MFGNPDSIIKIDIDKISEIKTMTPNAKYCIINKETYNAIESDLPYKTSREPEGYLNKETMICGLNLAICENLKFGQIEIK